MSRIPCYTEFVRNVTISLDDETARWARVEAARQDKSVSRFVAELLTRQMAASSQYEQSQVSFSSRPARVISSGRDSYPSRDEVHAR